MLKKILYRPISAMFFWVITNSPNIYKWAVYHEFHDGTGAGNQPMTDRDIIEWLLSREQNTERERYELNVLRK